MLRMSLIGAPSAHPDIVTRHIDDRGVPSGALMLGQLRGPNHPVATAVFAERLTRRLEALRDANGDAA
ncbi:MAG: hypothetical protein ABSG76_08205 [Xanthobacteraceae bacterium]|jgi:hypothetical protein